MRIRATSPATARLLVSLVVGIAVAVVAGLLTDAALAVLCGIVATAGVFDLLGVTILWRMSGEETQRRSTREVLRPVVDELVVGFAALGGIAGIVAMVVLADSSIRSAVAAVGLAGVFLTWGMLHLMYAARYAYLFYNPPVGGIDFNGDGSKDGDLPSYRDFLYFSFNLGMTYQVSDTDVKTSEIRAVVLRHCLLSYVFGTVILAATLNLVAGIVTG